jgi:hypothetical protein
MKLSIALLCAFTGLTLLFTGTPRWLFASAAAICAIAALLSRKKGRRREP